MRITMAEVLRTIHGLDLQARNVERDGHLNAARHMRNAADILLLTGLFTNAFATDPELREGHCTCGRPASDQCDFCKSFHKDHHNG